MTSYFREFFFQNPYLVAKKIHTICSTELQIN